MIVVDAVHRTRFDRHASARGEIETNKAPASLAAPAGVVDQRAAVRRPVRRLERVFGSMQDLTLSRGDINETYHASRETAVS